MYCHSHTTPPGEFCWTMSCRPTTMYCADVGVCWTMSVGLLLCIVIDIQLPLGVLGELYVCSIVQMLVFVGITECRPTTVAKPHSCQQFAWLQIHRRSAEKLLDLCCMNGGCFIKVGQHVASLDYLLPTEYVETLKVLHSQAPQSSVEDIYRVIQEDLGKEVGIGAPLGTTRTVEVAQHFSGASFQGGCGAYRIWAYRCQRHNAFILSGVRSVQQFRHNSSWCGVTGTSPQGYFERWANCGSQSATSQSTSPCSSWHGHHGGIDTQYSAPHVMWCDPLWVLRPLRLTELSHLPDEWPPPLSDPFFSEPPLSEWSPSQWAPLSLRVVITYISCLAGLTTLNMLNKSMNSLQMKWALS